MALVSPVDHNGVAIAVGDTVKLQGTVIAIDTASTHFGEIKVQLSYPLTAQANGGVPNSELAGFAPTVHSGGNVHYPKSDQIIECAALTLTH